MEPFTEEVISLIRSIPDGKVATYGQIAMMAGNPQGARQVGRILHSMSSKYNLPWFRVINSQGRISIRDPEGAEEQKYLLLKDGVEVSQDYRVNLNCYQWLP